MTPQPQGRGRARGIQPGTVFGKYEILSRIAVGGMAEIFVARVSGVAGFEKIVVLKRVLPNIADDPTFVQMFHDEVRLAATLQHPNIADVYDVGDADGSPFMAMEFVHGQDSRAIRLATQERGEKIPLAIALAIVHGAASALDYAHERRSPDGQPLELVHRDVSASNLMISYDGAIKLLDFGIARAAGHHAKTVTGTLKGKVPYMSPEQCRGQALDRRSDLFSLGIVMFELTTGRRPFRGDNDFDVMEQIVHKRAAKPSSLVENYQPELEAIVMKLLAHERDGRYATAEAMLHDLDAFLAKHRLWVSSKSIGKYMRHLFAAKIAAWERAESGGTSLAEYVMQTSVTPASMAAFELKTPASSHTVPRMAPLSREQATVQTLEYSAGAERISDLVAAQNPIAARSPVRAIGILTGLVLGAVVCIAGYFAWRDYGPRMTARAAQQPPVAAEAPEPEPPPVPSPPPPQVEVVKPAPTVTPIEVATPTPTPPPVEVAAPAPTLPVEPDPKAQAVKSAPGPKPGSHSKRTPGARSTASKSKKAQPAKPSQQPAQQPVQQPLEPPLEPPAEPAKPKEPTWDPNSPFLPPSR